MATTGQVWDANFHSKLYFQVHFTVYASWEMINSHYVNSQTALLSGADAVVLRTFEAEIHFVNLSSFHGRAHGRQWSALASSISFPSLPDPCADWNSVWNIMPVWLWSMHWNVWIKGLACLALIPSWGVLNSEAGIEYLLSGIMDLISIVDT